MNSMGVRQNTCTAMGRGLARCMFLCILDQHMEPTVVCAEFATWIVVLLFMPTGSLAYTPFTGSVSGT